MVGERSGRENELEVRSKQRKKRTEERQREIAGEVTGDLWGGLRGLGWGWRGEGWRGPGAGTLKRLCYLVTLIKKRQQVLYQGEWNLSFSHHNTG